MVAWRKKSLIISVLETPPVEPLENNSVNSHGCTLFVTLIPVRCGQREDVCLLTVPSALVCQVVIAPSAFATKKKEALGCSWSALSFMSHEKIIGNGCAAFYRNPLLATTSCAPVRLWPCADMLLGWCLITSAIFGPPYLDLLWSPPPHQFTIKPPCCWDSSSMALPAQVVQVVI